jgi:hypothetical protein
MSRKDKSAASSSGGLDFVPADHCSGEPFVAGRKSRVCHKIEDLAIGGLNRPKNIVFGLHGRDRRWAVLTISPSNYRFSEDRNKEAVVVFRRSYDFPSQGGGNYRLQRVSDFIEGPNNLMRFIVGFDPEGAGL